MSSATPEFLFVRPGDYVAIKKENYEDTKEKNENYWVINTFLFSIPFKFYLIAKVTFEKTKAVRKN